MLLLKKITLKHIRSHFETEPFGSISVTTNGDECTTAMHKIKMSKFDRLLYIHRVEYNRDCIYSSL